MIPTLPVRLHALYIRPQKCLEIAPQGDHLFQEVRHVKDHQK